MNKVLISERYVVLMQFFKPVLVIWVIWFSFVSGAPSADAAAVMRVLVLGDSLAAGYGLLVDESFPNQLEDRLLSAGLNVKVLNGGVSGDTSAGGRARLNWALTDNPQFAIIELGANDGLRGLDPEAMRDNLDNIIGRLKSAGIKVLLTGMRAPPNIGPNYGKKFDRVFPDLARKHDVIFYPFFLSGVAAIPVLNQLDGIHPNARGVAVIVDHIMPFVVRLLTGK